MLCSGSTECSIVLYFYRMSRLLLRYFPTAIEREGRQSMSFKVATLKLLRADGEVLERVVVKLDCRAHLLEITPLAQEIAATAWHRGTLIELPNGEVTLAD